MVTKHCYWSRRRFLGSALAGGLVGLATELHTACSWKGGARTFIAKVSSYAEDLAAAISSGLRELGVEESEIKGKRILLKPNLIEPRRGALHISTHPMVMRGAIEAFLRLGAAEVTVAEGAAHLRDTPAILEEAGLADILYEDKIPFVDLNDDPGYTVPNLGRRTYLKTLTLPQALHEVDWVVSVAKLKTHHWAGVTLSMKNLFGIMPGLIYGWPKNVFHFAGIAESILDITSTVKAHFAIVDGIMGMEGDGPIMGNPRQVGALVMGRNLPAVDATCTRIMGIDPFKVDYLAAASEWLGPVAESSIAQIGEPISSVKTHFRLPDSVPVLRALKG